MAKRPRLKRSYRYNKVDVGSARANVYQAKCKVAWGKGFAALKHHVQATSKMKICEARVLGCISDKASRLPDSIT